MTGRKVFGGRFEPVEQVASSPTHWVFRAVDHVPEGDGAADEVVLEVFPPGVGERSDDFRRRFSQAMRAAAAIDHANVAVPLGGGFDHGSYFVAGRVPVGRPLAGAAPGGAARSAEGVTETARELVEALAAAHDAGVAHGNLAAGEVTVADDDDRVVVHGFGRAYVLGAHDDPAVPPSVEGDLRDLAVVVRGCLGPRPTPATLGRVLERLDHAGDEGGYRTAAEARADLDPDADGARAGGAGACEVAPSRPRDPVAGPGLLRALPWPLKVLLAVLAVGALAGPAMLLAGRLGFRFGEAPEALVPDVAGLSQEVAVERLDGVGLDHALQSQESNTVAEGEVIEQLPSAGTDGREGDTVTLVISTGGVPVRVPEVIGLQEDEARAAIEAANLEVLVEDDPRGGFTPGEVVSQQPGGGNNADEGDTVTVIVTR